MLAGGSSMPTRSAKDDKIQINLKSLGWKK